MKLPAEYAALGKLPTLWKPTDVIAEASLIGGIFGKGGGAEVRSALAAEAFEARYGRRAGRKAWEDFREQNDPEAPTTVSKRVPLRDGLAVREDGAGDARTRLGDVPLRRRLGAAPIAGAAGDRHAFAAADPERRLDRLAAAAKQPCRAPRCPRTGSSSTPRTRRTATRSP